MPTLSFEGETQQELVQKVRRWLASVDGARDGADLTPTEVISQGAELTKEALRLVAQAAPAPVAESDLVKQLTKMGYQATDATKDEVKRRLERMIAAHPAEPVALPPPKPKPKPAGRLRRIRQAPHSSS